MRLCWALLSWLHEPHTNESIPLGYFEILSIGCYTLIFKSCLETPIRPSPFHAAIYFLSFLVTEFLISSTRCHPSGEAPSPSCEPAAPQPVATPHPPRLWSLLSPLPLFLLRPSSLVAQCPLGYPTVSHYCTLHASLGTEQAEEEPSWAERLWRLTQENNYFFYHPPFSWPVRPNLYLDIGSKKTISHPLGGPASDIASSSPVACVAALCGQ
jgi:hypothetical protein